MFGQLSTNEILGIVASAIAIVGAIVAVTAYVVRLQGQIREAELKKDLERTKAEAGNVEKQYAELRARHQETLRAGSYLAGKKHAIDIELANLTDTVEASSSSILVPAPSEVGGEEPSELVFLSLLGEGSEKLKGVRVSMESIAGSVFTTKKPRILHDPRRESTVSNKTDAVANIRTEEMLALPMLLGAKCIGVAEFINKTENRQFDAKDQQNAERGLASLSAKVAEFVQDPNNFIQLGITPKTKPEEATVLFGDLSKSSMLLARFDASAALDFLNEYFETLCGIAIAHDGAIDKFIGDGFMVTFNVRRAVAQHETKAVAAALEMQQGFAEVMRKWKVFNIPVIYNRIGIESGPVHKAEMGHSLYRQLTVMGEPVNLASNLCDLGDRDRNVILIGDNLNRLVSPQFMTRPLPPEKLQGFKRNLAAYEVISPGGAGAAPGGRPAT
ncbi:MAG TPA: adenylate/guanylate cyclase domain-containing protein [Pyrinomonadaceae bacterium]|nr:adenylate/guanylate cyclase domain-containing protein [Pyrinomonadaceae bacterium]